MKSLIKIAMVLGLAIGLSACSKKSGQTANLYRGSGARMQPGGIPGAPNQYPNQYPNQNQQGSQTTNGGYIYNDSYRSSDWSPLLTDFLLLENGQLGYVSGSTGQQTGVFFTGQVDRYATSGKIEIVVWDDRASSEGAFVATFQLKPKSNFDANSLNGAQFTLEFQDSYGSVYFNGRFSNGKYTGSVTYLNSSDETHQEKSLGSFITSDCGFITGC